jgi:predicted RNase H-like HicB family nuclease
VTDETDPGSEEMHCPRVDRSDAKWLRDNKAMEVAIKVQIEQLPEGFFLATSQELPGLVAQGRTVAETLEIARDVARKLIEALREREESPVSLLLADNIPDYTIVVGS